MTLTEILADVSSFLSLTVGASTRVTSTEATQWINQAYHMAETRLFAVDNSFWTIDSQELDTTADDDSYAVESDFLGMKRLEIQYEDGVDKVRATPISMNEVPGTLSPENETWSKDDPYYWLIDSTIYIKPTPDETSSTWTTDNGSAIKYWYYQMGTDLSGATVPVLPLTHHHILAYFAAMNGHLKLGNDSKAGEFENKWERGLRSMVGEYSKIDKTQALSFSVSRGRNKASGIFRP